MAYKKHYTLSFRSLYNDTLYTVNVYDSMWTSNEVVTLKGGADPFVTQMDDDDDFTKAYRGQTGHLNIVTKDGSLLNDIMPLTPKQMLVQLVSGENADTLVWSGFIQQKAMSQTYLEYAYSISVPIISALKMFAETELSSSANEFASWRDCVNRMAYDDGICHFNNYLLAYTDPNTDEKYTDLDRFIWQGPCYKGFWEGAFKKLRNFEDVYRNDENGEMYESEKYGAVMDDYLKLYGYVVYEENGNLVVKDVTAAKNKYRKFAFGSTELGTDETLVDVSDINTFDFASTDNDESFVEAKKSITIDCNVDEPETVFSCQDLPRVIGISAPLYVKDDYQLNTARSFRSTPEITTYRYSSSWNPKIPTRPIYERLAYPDPILDSNNPNGGEFFVMGDNDYKAFSGLILSSNRPGLTYKLLTLSVSNVGRFYYGKHPYRKQHTYAERRSYLYMKFEPMMVNTSGVLSDIPEFGEEYTDPWVELPMTITYKTSSGDIVKNAVVNIKHDTDSFQLPTPDIFGNYYFGYQIYGIEIDFLSNFSLGTSVRDLRAIILKDFELTFSSIDDKYVRAYGTVSDFPGKKKISNEGVKDYSFTTRFGECWAYNSLLASKKTLYNEVTGEDGIIRNMYGAPALAQTLMKKYEPIMNHRMQLLKLEVRDNVSVTDKIHWKDKDYTPLAVEKHWRDDVSQIKIADFWGEKIIVTFNRITNSSTSYDTITLSKKMRCDVVIKYHGTYTSGSTFSQTVTIKAGNLTTQTGHGAIKTAITADDIDSITPSILGLYNISTNIINS